MSLITTTWGRFAAPERRTMGVACGAHVLHDGYTDLLYVLLPIWQAQFGLGYAEVGVLRALFTGSMAGLQVPAGALAERIGGPLVLGLGTALVGVGFLAAGASAGYRACWPWRWCWPGPAPPCSTRSRPISSRRRFPGGARAPRSPATISPAISARWRFRPHGGSRRGDAVAERDLAARRLRARRRRRDPERARPAGTRQRAGRRGRRESRRARRQAGERARVSAAAVDRDDRQRDPDGVSDVSAVSAEAEGRRPADDRHRVDPGLHRRRRRQAGLRLARRAARRGQGGVPDRGLDGRRHCRAAAVAAVRRARSCCR